MQENAEQSKQGATVSGEVSTQVTDVSDLRRQVRNLGGNTRIGFSEKEGFELMYRVATMIARSDLVPDIFRENIEVKKGNNIGTLVKNPGGISNCMLALNVATQLEMDVLMVMGNMMIIDGRLSWSSQFVIAAVNRSKKFTAIRFDVVRESAAREFDYVGKEWDDHSRRYNNVKKKVNLVNRSCIAWAIEKETGERVESPEVSLEMAVAEGWYGKKGSKWQTMPDVMLRYRAASFFGKLYAPDMLMGMPSEDEVEDMRGDGYDSQKPAGNAGTNAGVEMTEGDRSVKPDSGTQGTAAQAGAKQQTDEKTSRARQGHPEQSGGGNRMDLRNKKAQGGQAEGAVSAQTQNKDSKPSSDDFENLTDEELLEQDL